MKSFLLVSYWLLTMSFINWQPDFDKAQAEAKSKHHLILLNFSGSDWCGPCIMMRSEIFEDKSFSAMAEASLVLVNADFPRKKKNKLNNNTRLQNEALAEKYNPAGKFPFTLLLDPAGKVIRTWEGLPDEGVAGFSKQVKADIYAYQHQK